MSTSSIVVITLIDICREKVTGRERETERTERNRERESERNREKQREKDKDRDRYIYRERKRVLLYSAIVYCHKQQLMMNILPEHPCPLS